MTDDMKWIDDSETPSLKLRSFSSSDAEDVSIVDAYAQWNLRTGFGLEFEAFSREPKSHKTGSLDYCFVDRIEQLGGEPDILFPMQNGSVQRIDASKKTHAMVVRLPLREASVAKDYSAQNNLLNSASHNYISHQSSNHDGIVIVGIVDVAFNAINERFRSGKTGSRVDFLWVQDAEAIAESAVAYGREFGRSDIEAVLNDRHLDETGQMQALELIGKAGEHRISSLRRRVSHGTAVADLAAGYDANDPAGTDRRIIAVQLPALAARDTSGANLIALAKAATHYIYDRALVMSRKLDSPIPVVLNFSFGTGGGSRTGRFILERTMRHHALQYKRALISEGIGEGATFRVMPAGNANLSQGHVVGSQGKKTSQLDCVLRLQPADQTSSFAEFWLPLSAKSADIKVTLPDGYEQTFNWTKKDGFKNHVLKISDNVIARISVDMPHDLFGSNTSQTDLFFRVLFAFAPTDTTGLLMPRSPAPSGPWAISINAKFKSKAVPIQGWIQRDDAPGGRQTTARQAYFDDFDYTNQRFDPKGDLQLTDPDDPTSVIRRDGTLSGMATSLKSPDTDETKDEAKTLDTIVVAAMRWDEDSLAPYSAAGDVYDIEAPQLAARVDRSRMKPHLLVSGSRSGSRVALNGTSLSAPQVARALANYLATLSKKNRAALTTKDVIAALVATKPVDPTRATRLSGDGGIIKHAAEIIKAVERH